MAISKINNPHVPYIVLAESTGAKTYAQHLTALKSAYDALSTEEKASSAIISRGLMHHANNLSSTGEFTFIAGDTTSIYVETLQISSNPKAVGWSIKTTGNTLSDMGSETLNTPMQLVLGA